MKMSLDLEVGRLRLVRVRKVALRRKVLKMMELGEREQIARALEMTHRIAVGSDGTNKARRVEGRFEADPSARNVSGSQSGRAEEEAHLRAKRSSLIPSREVSC